MRNFDERMNEIRKRAELLRKMRQRRQKMAVCCTVGAACLCLAVLNPVFKAQKQALPEGVISAGAGETVFYSQDSCPVAEVRVSADGTETSVQDPEKIAHILTIVQLDVASGKLPGSATPNEVALPEGSNMTTGGTRGENHTYDDAQTDQSKNSGGESQKETWEELITDCLTDSQYPVYTLRLILTDGAEMRYLLTEAGVEDPETGLAVALDKEQRQILEQLLGIG